MLLERDEFSLSSPQKAKEFFAKSSARFEWTDWFLHTKISCCDNDKASNSFHSFVLLFQESFEVFQLKPDEKRRKSFSAFLLIIYCIESSSAAVQSIIMHLNAVWIKKNKISLLHREFACKHSHRIVNALLMDKRIEMMKYLRFECRSIQINAPRWCSVCKFGKSTSKIYFMPAQQTIELKVSLPSLFSCASLLLSIFEMRD